MKILVVDDDPHIADFVTTALLGRGHDIASVGRGSEALAAALRDDYDLLICDLNLPDLQGTDIVRALKAQAPRLPVMVISALSAKDWAGPCEDAGATRFLEKPLRVEDLISEVELVEKARLNLRIAIIDTDAFHRKRLSMNLHALGSDVCGYATAEEARVAIEDAGAGLLLIDSAVASVEELIGWGHKKGIPVFVLAEQMSEDLEERMMRAGAAFMLSKPVDTDTLLTQAAFLAAA